MFFPRLFRTRRPVNERLETLGDAWLNYYAGFVVFQVRRRELICAIFCCGCCRYGLCLLFSMLLAECLLCFWIVNVQGCIKSMWKALLTLYSLFFLSLWLNISCVHQKQKLSHVLVVFGCFGFLVIDRCAPCLKKSLARFGGCLH